MHREHGNNPFQHTNPLHFQCPGRSGPVTAAGDILSFMSLPVLEENPLNEGICFPKGWRSQWHESHR